jgi:hypothetical protein
MGSESGYPVPGGFLGDLASRLVTQRGPGTVTKLEAARTSLRSEHHHCGIMVVS